MALGLLMLFWQPLNALLGAGAASPTDSGAAGRPLPDA